MGASSDTLARLRRLVLALFYLSAVVLSAELLLLEHVESLLQLLPLAGIALAVAAMTWAWRRPGSRSIRTAQGVMVLLAVVGAVGLWLHYRANVEFELERHPDRAGWALFVEAMHGAMPALAPGLLGQLGLLGLAWTLGHPARSAPDPTHEEDR